MKRLVIETAIRVGQTLQQKPVGVATLKFVAVLVVGGVVISWNPSRPTASIVPESIGNLPLIAGMTSSSSSASAKDSAGGDQTDNLDKVDSSSVQSKMGEGDLLTLQLFPTSPFSNGKLVNRQDFDAMTREFSARGQYPMFKQAATEVLNQTGLCSGGSGLEGRLRDCANRKPDEFATVSNMIRSYFEWQNSELRTVLQLYQGKLTSPILKDRLEARLVSQCLRDQMASKDTTAALQACKSPAAWKPYVNRLFYATCSTSSTSTGSFHYKSYLKDCVFSSVVKKSLGTDLVLQLMPDFKIDVDQTGVTLTTEPMTAAPGGAYYMIYQSVYNFMSTESFSRLATNGCLPSIFIDSTSLASASAGQLPNYYSVCIPQGIVQKLTALPKIDSDFFKSIIARRIATIQMLEMINGGVLIAEEAQRNIMASDREIGQLVGSYPQYLGEFSKMYKDSIDLTYGRKLDDVLEQIDELFDNYQTEINQYETSSAKISREVAQMKSRQKSGRY